VTPDYTQLTGVPISIVLECTALQAFLVAGAFLFGCRGGGRKRLKTFLIIAPIIYFVNLVRNAIVIILVHNNGADYFDFAHNYIGKTLSLVVLIILIIMAFIIVPELYEDINGLFELPWRRGPKHNYLRFVGRLYGDKEEAGSGEDNQESSSKEAIPTTENDEPPESSKPET
jgi:exosortase/archaeosortase family protein